MKDPRMPNEMRGYGKLHLDKIKIENKIKDIQSDVNNLNRLITRQILDVQEENRELKRQLSNTTELLHRAEIHRESLIIKSIVEFENFVRFCIELFGDMTKRLYRLIRRK